MLGVFSKLRYRLVPGEGTAKYVRYALGEILLISVGILIAIQVDNWNEDRVEQEQVRQYARALIGDLKADMVMIEPVHEQVTWLGARAERLAKYVRDREFAELDNVLLDILTWQTSYRPFGWNRTALEQLKASGALRQMRNQQLVAEISAYEALTRHLDEDYISDESAGTTAAAHRMRVVNMNHDRSLLDVFDSDGEGETDDDAIMPLEFLLARRAAYQGPTLPLLVDDMREVQRTVNAYLNLERTTRARADNEIPRLKRMAVELIAKLEAEYPE